MEKLTESEQDSLNLFQEEKDSKTVEKESMNVTEAENVAGSSNDLIAEEIDEDIAVIQAEAVMAVARSMENAINNTGEMKPSNLEIEAALYNKARTSDEETTSSSINDRTSLTECQLAAYLADKTYEEACRVVADGEDLMETITSTIHVLQSHIHAFSVKATEATTDKNYDMADFYYAMSSKFESAVISLFNRKRKVEVALNRVEESANECRKYAALAEEITDESLDESKRTKFSACFWTNKGRAAIIVTLKKKRAAIFLMRRIWISVRNDMGYEESTNSTAEDDSDDETQQCENRDRKAKIGHIVATFLGLSLLSVTSFFQVGSDSFYAILTLGLVTTGWCAVYWSHKFYKCLKSYKRCKSDDNQQTVIETERRDSFLENCDKYLDIVKNHLLKYDVIMDSETESDTGSLETVRVEDISQSS